MRLKPVLSTLGLLICILLLALGTWTYFAGWADVKLRLTRFWGYFTIYNNPLLPALDKDLPANTNNGMTPRISRDQLVAGGPPKDGIPSIDHPRFVSYEQSSFSDSDTVVGVTLKGEAKAYPYGILNWHEIVNDVIGSQTVTITMCPLCDTNPAFIRKINGHVTTFGVSGKLFQSCLVMYDRKSDSLWVQPWGIGVMGRYTNRSLTRIPVVKTTLGRWHQAHPKTLVLSTDTGYERDYHRYPYGSYPNNRTLIFPVRNTQLLMHHPKATISYIWLADNKTPQNQFSGPSKQVLHERLEKIKEETFQLGQETVIARWDSQMQTVRFYRASDNQELGASTAFAFVYPAFFSK